MSRARIRSFFILVRLTVKVPRLRFRRFMLFLAHSRLIVSLVLRALSLFLLVDFEEFFGDCRLFAQFAPRRNISQTKKESSGKRKIFSKRKSHPGEGRLSLLLLNSQVNQGVQFVSAGPFRQGAAFPRMMPETIHLREIRLIIISPAFCFLRPVASEPLPFNPDPARNGKECVRAFSAFHGANFAIRAKHTMAAPKE